MRDRGAARTSAGSTSARALAVALALVAAACSQVDAVDRPDPALCAPRVQSRLVFGLDTPAGRVGDADWQAFIDEVVAPRFDDEALTVLDARGRRRDANGAATNEPSRVLELVHVDSISNRQRLAEIVGAYKLRFREPAVPLTQMPVRSCA